MPAFTHKGSFNLTLTFMAFMESYELECKINKGDVETTGTTLLPREAACGTVFHRPVSSLGVTLLTSNSSLEKLWKRSTRHLGFI